MREPLSCAHLLARVLALLSLVAAVTRAGTEPTEQIHGALSEVHGVRVLRVWGTPSQRGYAHGFLLARDIIELFDQYLSPGPIGGVASYRTIALPMTKLMRISPAYDAELRGMLAGIEARTGGPAQVASLGRALGYDDLVAINCIPDLAMFGCSSFAVWGPMTADGSTLAGRNLDWRRLDALDGSQLVVVYPPQPEQDSLGWVSITWPGYIGCLTGMNAQGVTVCMHDVRARPPTVATGFTPRGLALRSAIESARAASAVEDIGRVLRSHTCVVGNNVPVTIPHKAKSTGSVVFEYDGFLSRTDGVTLRTPSAQPHQLCTNHYRKRAEPVACDRFKTIHARLGDLGIRAQTLDIDGAWKILRSVARPSGVVFHLVTYHSVVFEPNKRRMHVAFSKNGRPAPQCEPVTLNVAELLAGDCVGGSSR